ncbi:MAG: cyclase family protein [Treponema sp.]|nr:cyclase family protein [Treponema sp.]
MKKLYDLTHIIDPAGAARKFSIKTIGADEVNPNVVRLENQWYIMHEINMVNHIGTHIETPYHLFRDGEDLSVIAPHRYCGPALAVDLKNLPPKSPISREMLIRAGENAGGIRPGDIVLFNLGYSDKYGTPEYGDSPYFSSQAIRWIVEQQVKMMGVDAGGVEIPGSEEHVNHRALFEKGILLVENLANLDRLPAGRFNVYAFPVPIKGMDSFPLRVVAEA